MLVLFILFYLVFNAKACPNGSIASFSNPPKCYHFVTQKQNWISAVEICKTMGGDVISIHDFLDNVFISGEAENLFTDSASGDFWIGANNLMSAGGWSWIDGTPFDFTDWDVKQPIKTANCGAALMQSSKWIADDCFKNKSFVCLINKDSIPATTTHKPTRCLDTWTYYPTTGYCYKVFDNATFLDAEDRCRISGAHLTSIHGEDENLFVANLAYWPGADVCDGTKQSWVGLFREDIAGRWEWTDGSAFDYHNWAIGTPYNDTGYNYGYMDITSICNEPTGRMRNTIINVLLAKFVCKKTPF
uniref:C-type lectin domain-containing protein n=1 Tax=Panagrolaimus sp. ES5 TaxID=591445 RepID=A0AC34GSZ0_9BILA